MCGRRKLFALKKYSMLSFSTLLLAALCGVLISTSSEGMSSGSSNMTDQSSNLSGFQATCSTWIGIAVEEGSENNTDISCLQKVLEKCQPYDATLGYVLGSMRVSIIGLSNGGDNCSLSIVYEIERGQTNMTCTIPVDMMSIWTNWRRGDGLDAIDQISSHCSAPKN